MRIGVAVVVCSLDLVQVRPIPITGRRRYIILARIMARPPIMFRRQFIIRRQFTMHPRRPITPHHQSITAQVGEAGERGQAKARWQPLTATS
jgi:hypothetical protein